MPSHGFIGEICMPSELIPERMPLSMISRNGGPLPVAVPEM